MGNKYNFIEANYRQLIDRVSSNLLFSNNLIRFRFVLLFNICRLKKKKLDLFLKNPGPIRLNI